MTVCVIRLLCLPVFLLEHFLLVSLPPFAHERADWPRRGKQTRSAVTRAFGGGGAHEDPSRPKTMDVWCVCVCVRVCVGGGAVFVVFVYLMLCSLVCCCCCCCSPALGILLLRPIHAARTRNLWNPSRAAPQCSQGVIFTGDFALMRSISLDFPRLSSSFLTFMHFPNTF